MPKKNHKFTLADKRKVAAGRNVGQRHDDGSHVRHKESVNKDPDRRLKDEKPPRRDKKPLYSSRKPGRGVTCPASEQLELEQLYTAQHLLFQDSWFVRGMPLIQHSFELSVFVLYYKACYSPLRHTQLKALQSGKLYIYNAGQPSEFYSSLPVNPHILYRRAIAWANRLDHFRMTLAVFKTRIQSSRTRCAFLLTMRPLVVLQHLTDTPVEQRSTLDNSFPFEILPSVHHWLDLLVGTNMEHLLPHNREFHVNNKLVTRILVSSPRANCRLPSHAVYGAYVHYGTVKVSSADFIVSDWLEWIVQRDPFPRRLRIIHPSDSIEFSHGSTACTTLNGCNGESTNSDDVDRQFRCHAPNCGLRFVGRNELFAHIDASGHRRVRNAPRAPRVRGPPAIPAVAPPPVVLPAPVAPEQMPVVLVPNADVANAPLDGNPAPNPIVAAAGHPQHNPLPQGLLVPPVDNPLPRLEQSWLYSIRPTFIDGIWSQWIANPLSAMLMYIPVVRNFVLDPMDAKMYHHGFRFKRLVVLQSEQLATLTTYALTMGLGDNGGIWNTITHGCLNVYKFTDLNLIDAVFQKCLMYKLHAINAGANQRIVSLVSLNYPAPIPGHEPLSVSITKVLYEHLPMCTMVCLLGTIGPPVLRCCLGNSVWTTEFVMSTLHTALSGGLSFPTWGSPWPILGKTTLSQLIDITMRNTTKLACQLYSVGRASLTFLAALAAYYQLIWTIAGADVCPLDVTAAVALTATTFNHLSEIVGELLFIGCSGTIMLCQTLCVPIQNCLQLLWGWL